MQQLFVGWGFRSNKNNEIQKSTSCHPELVSGSYRHQKCSTNCTQKTNVGLSAQPTLSNTSFPDTENFNFEKDNFKQNPCLP